MPKYHITPKTGPNNKKRIAAVIKERAAELMGHGYAKEDATYLAEHEVLPRYYITPVTDLKKEAAESLLKEHAITLLASLKSVRLVLRKMNISRRKWNEWAQKDPQFFEAISLATEDIADELEEEAFIRATVGQSDALLTLMLRAYRPEKFTPRKEISGPDGGPITMVQANAKDLLKAKLQQFADKTAAGQVEIDRVRAERGLLTGHTDEPESEEEAETS